MAYSDAGNIFPSLKTNFGTLGALSKQKFKHVKQNMHVQ